MSSCDYWDNVMHDLARVTCYFIACVAAVGKERVAWPAGDVMQTSLLCILRMPMNHCVLVQPGAWSHVSLEMFTCARIVPPQHA